VTTTTWTVRTANFDELEPRLLYEVLRLRIDVFVVEQACAFGDLDGRDHEPGAIHLWLEGNDAVIAYARILPEPDGTTSIGRIVTHPAHRDQGVGAALLHEAMARIAGPMVLNAQARLAGWYERFGFVVTGPSHIEDGIEHVPMRHEPGH